MLVLKNCFVKAVFRHVITMYVRWSPLWPKYIRNVGDATSLTLMYVFLKCCDHTDVWPRGTGSYELKHRPYCFCYSRSNSAYLISVVVVYWHTRYVVLCSTDCKLWQRKSSGTQNAPTRQSNYFTVLKEISLTMMILKKDIVSALW
jgi:hypothetical protein